MFFPQLSAQEIKPQNFRPGPAMLEYLYVALIAFNVQSCSRLDIFGYLTNLYFS